MAADQPQVSFDDLYSTVYAVLDAAKTRHCQAVSVRFAAVAEPTTKEAPLMSAPTQPAIRRRMPRHRAGYTTSFEVAGAEFYLTANPHDDGSLGEVFIKFGKQGSTLGGLLDAVSISVSLGLQSGVGLETYASKYIDMRFEPMGLTDDPMVPTVTSVLDYVFRRLALDFLDTAACTRLGMPTLDDEARTLVGV